MKCVIIGNAEIQNYDKMKTFLDPNSYFVVCDGGLKHIKSLGVSPNLIVGDFDSFAAPQQNDFPAAEIIQLPREKDDTDVFFAIKEALKRGFTEFELLGVIGQRFDHSLVNISVLFYLKNHEANGIIYDDYSKMQLVGQGIEPVLVPDFYSYFSIICVDGTISGVTIKNAKYPLLDGEITTSYQYGISNEVIKNQNAEISIKKGTALLVQVF